MLEEPRSKEIRGQDKADRQKLSFTGDPILPYKIRT